MTPCLWRTRRFSNNSRMTDYAAMVRALRVGRAWREVATACEGLSWRPRGSYYRSIAKGTIKRPNAIVCRRIVAAYLKHCCDDVTGCYNALGRTLHHNVSIKRPLGPAINQWRQAHSMTWDQWHAKAHELMRREYVEGSEE